MFFANLKNSHIWKAIDQKITVKMLPKLSNRPFPLLMKVFAKQPKAWIFQGRP
jgi:hypothetical protein